MGPCFAALTCDEEVGGRLTVSGLVPHVDEVLARLVGGTVVDLLALVDHADLVEDLVELLASLVDRNDSRLTANVGGNAQSLHELEGRRRTEK